MQIHNDIWINHIFTFLDLQSLGRVSSVCKEWKKMADEKTPWEKMAKTLYPCELTHEDPKEFVKIWKEAQAIINNSYTPSSMGENIIRGIDEMFGLTQLRSISKQIYNQFLNS